MASLGDSRPLGSVGLKPPLHAVEQVPNGEDCINLCGSLAVRVLPSVSLITEWMGQDLAVSTFMMPLKGIPLVVSYFCF